MESNEDIKKLLVVDDDELNRKILTRVLSNFYVLDSVNSGPEAIRVAESEDPPDLILLDISMPVMDGFEVCRHLKKSEETRDIPVIFVTGRTDDKTLKLAFESGAVDYVRKPASRIELMARIESVFRQQNLMEELLKEEKLKGVLDLAGAVCHELNQPMQAVTGYSELLLMDFEEGDPVAANISVIKEQVEKMGLITHRLMKITRCNADDFVRDSFK